MEKEMSFEEMYNESLKEAKLSKVVTGKVISITSNGEIFIDIGYKADGIIPKEEYTENDTNLLEGVKIGDEITAEVLKQNDGIGNVLLSYKKLKNVELQQQFENKVKNNEIIESKVSEVTDNGLIVNVANTKVFIPYSLSSISRNEDKQSYKNKKVSFRVVEYNPKGRKVIGSIKNVVDEQRQAKENQFWSSIEVGQTRKGKVASLSSYGAFVDVDGVQGLLHASEISWARNVKPADVLRTGQEIDVKVLEVDKENKRLKFSYVDKGPNPWDNIEEKYKVNDVVKVKVAKMMPFGVFVELEPAIEGLVHISQIAEKKIAKPEDVLKQDEYVNAKIIEVDKEKQRIELSIKELEGTSDEYKQE